MSSSTSPVYARGTIVLLPAAGDSQGPILEQCTRSSTKYLESQELQEVSLLVETRGPTCSSAARLDEGEAKAGNDPICCLAWGTGRSGDLKCIIRPTSEDPLTTHSNNGRRDPDACLKIFRGSNMILALSTMERFRLGSLTGPARQSLVDIAKHTSCRLSFTDADMAARSGTWANQMWVQCVLYSAAESGLLDEDIVHEAIAWQTKISQGL